MTLLGAFQALLSHYCNQLDVAVGVPVSGRSHPALEGLIGCFVNMLVLRTRLAWDMSFVELMQLVRQTSIEAFEHKEAPYERLVEATGAQRRSDGSPLVSAVFQLLEFGDDMAMLGPLKVSRAPTSEARAHFDLELHLRAQGESLRGSLVYNVDLFDAQTIDQMVGSFLMMLQGVIANPHQRLDELPLITADQERRLLVEWNPAAVDAPLHESVHAMFEAQVQQTPDATAIVNQDRSLTYRELNNRANCLAARLQSLGVGSSARSDFVLADLWNLESESSAFSNPAPLTCRWIWTIRRRGWSSWPGTRCSLMSLACAKRWTAFP